MKMHNELGTLKQIGYHISLLSALNTLNTLKTLALYMAGIINFAP